MTVASDREILKAIDAGDIVIEPFKRENLNSASYDITIGPNYYYTSTVYGDRGQEHAKWHLAVTYIGAITIPGNGFILAHTQETAGTRRNWVPEIRTRSTVARMGLDLGSANWGDVGYVFPWTLEIHNRLPIAIKVPVGARIGQLVFHHVGETDIDYAKTGNYMAEEWTPEMMLPKQLRG